MAISEIPIEMTADALGSIGKLGLYLQTIGLIVIIWLVFQIVSLILNYKTKKRITKIEDQLTEMEKQVKKISKSKK